MTNDPAAHPGSSSPAGTPASGSRQAGPYGFSRFEIGGLLAIVVLVGFFGLYRWYGRRGAEAAPRWLVEEVILDPDVSPTSAPKTASAAPRDSVPQTPRASATIDINSAGESELERLPGIGRELARRIVRDRQTRGRYCNLLDLQRVSGIGPKKVAALAGWVRFSTAPDTAATDDE